MSNYPKQFTIRVYGLILNEQNEVLVTDEIQLDMPMTNKKTSLVLKYTVAVTELFAAFLSTLVMM